MQKNQELFIAKQGSQLVVRSKPTQSKELAMYTAPLSYYHDGYSRRSYSYDQETRELIEIEGYKGTVFEILEEKQKKEAPFHF